MIKAVFFDLDETLADTMSAQHEANIYAFREFGYDYQTIREQTKIIDTMGRRIIDFLRLIKEGAGITEKKLPLKNLYEARKKYFFNLIEDNDKLMKLYPGAKECLFKVKKTGVITAIVSSGTKKYIKLILKKFKLFSFVNFIISGDEINKGKPDPECYEKAYQYLVEHYGKIRKDECLVVEDTEIGVIAANKAGLKILLVPSRYSVLPKTVKPDYQLKSLKDFNKTILL